jgi:long-chain acyl-CoA synthetase
MDKKPWRKKYDLDVPHTLDYPLAPVFHTLEETARKHPHKTCTLLQGDSITYQEMDFLTNRLAAALVDLGVGKGDRIALFMANIPQFVLAFYGALKAGGTVVAINPTYKETETYFQLVDSGAVLVIASNVSKSMLDSIQPQTKVASIIYTDFQDAFQLSNLANSDALPKQKPAVSINHSQFLPHYNLLDLLSCYMKDGKPNIEISGEDPAIFQYSGGTTGTPKAVIGLHRNLTVNIFQFRHWLAVLKEGEETVLAAIPLFHVYGMVIGMGVGVHLGAKLVLIPNPRDIHDILQNIETHRATLFPGVPNMYHAIGYHPDVVSGKYDLTSLKACISGSAPLLRDTKEQFERISGAKLVEGYGLSETPTATHCNPIMGENRTGSIGLPLPDVDARIISLEDEKTELPPGENGELIIHGPQLMQGYHNMPLETSLALREGWLFTGDIATMDVDGFFYLIDRKKDVIKVGGLQVWPREVEEIISGHPSVLEVGVGGVMHPHYGETVKAWVVLKPNYSASTQEIITWCKEHISDYKAPRQVEFIAQLPRTTVGKLLRRELIRQHNERESGLNSR